MLKDSSSHEIKSILSSYPYDNLDNFAVGHIASVILIIAEHQALENQVVDKEINVAAMMVKLVNEI